MTQPMKIEYSLGADRYGRRTRLVADRESNGAVVWTICSDPVNQRDEGEIIRSLTTDQLAEAGKIAERFVKGGGRL